jgi:hypothetical protein
MSTNPIEEVVDSSAAPSDVDGSKDLAFLGYTHSENAVKPHDNSAPESRDTYR